MDEQEALIESLATPGAPIDIQILESTVQMMNRSVPNSDASEKARFIIERFSERSDSWTIAFDVLNSQECSDSTKFIVLKILRDTVKTSWSLFDQETRESIIQFILPQSVNLVNMNAQQSCINKADEVIVEILKYEWPNDYPTFIDDLLQSMSESKNSFKNGMIILQELASDINDYNNCGITSERSIDMSDAFEQQFPQVFEAISSVFISQDSDILSDSDVVHTILKALKSFIPLVDIRYFIATQLFSVLCDNFLSDPEFIFDVIDIFSEISTTFSMPPEFKELIPDIFKSVVQNLSSVLEANSDEDESKSPFLNLPENLIQILAFSLTSFLSRFSSIIFLLDDGAWARTAIEWLIQITEIANNDSLQTCLDFWMKITLECHSEYFEQNQAGNDERTVSQLSFYGSFFTALEQVLIERFIVPFEIKPREDEDGFQWDEVTENTSPLYKPMKTSLFFLTDMNSSEVFGMLMDLLNAASSDESGFDALNLFAWNSACLTSPICDEFTASAFEIVASSMNEICNSYLWFVSQHARFLSTRFDILQDIFQSVIDFLIEEETRNFAIFTLKSLFENTQFNDTFVANGLHEPFIGSLLQNDLITDDFVIEPASTIISYAINHGNEGNPVNDEEKERLLSLLLDPNNAKWSELSTNLDESNFPSVVCTMRSYGKAAYILGPLFISNVMKILPSFVEVHKFFSSVSVSTNEQAIIMRHVKTSIVVAIESFAKKLTLCSPFVAEFVLTQCLPMSENFSNSQKEARDPSLLRLFGLFCEKYGDFLLPQMELLFSFLFIPTMNIITNADEMCSSFGNDGSCDSFDEDVINMHRSYLLSFIDGTVKGCIDFVASFNESTLNSFVETIQFLISFLNKQDIASKSIKILAGFVESVRLNASQEFISDFASNYGVPLVVDSFRIVTDPCYNFAFNEICGLIVQLLKLPLLNENAPELTTTLHQGLFQQIDESFLLDVVSALIQNLDENLNFRQVLRDFLINIKKVGRNDENFLRDEIEIEKMQLQQQIQNEMQMNIVEA